MNRILPAALLVTLASTADAGVLYQQPPDPGGTYYRSSWWDPDGSNYDEYVWDRFVLPQDAGVEWIEWRGTYNSAFGGGTPVVNFTVAIYGASVGGTQPDVANPPLAEYEVGGNAGETFAGVVGGATMYDYAFTLPAAFPAQAGVPYWVQIEAWQNAYPGWSIARGTGGDGYHFLCQHLTLEPRNGVPTGCWFTAPTGDAAFTLGNATGTGVDASQGAGDLALDGALPNPSRGGPLHVSFSLPGGEPAALSLFDVGGRRVAHRSVGSLGAGGHVVDLAPEEPMAPGIYFVRLTQGSRSRMAKVVVTR